MSLLQSMLLPLEHVPVPAHRKQRLWDKLKRFACGPAPAVVGQHSIFAWSQFMLDVLIRRDLLTAGDV